MVARESRGTLRLRDCTSRPGPRRRAPVASGRTESHATPQQRDATSDRRAAAWGSPHNSLPRFPALQRRAACGGGRKEGFWGVHVSRCATSEDVICAAPTGLGQTLRSHSRSAHDAGAAVRTLTAGPRMNAFRRGARMERATTWCRRAPDGIRARPPRRSWRRSAAGRARVAARQAGRACGGACGRCRPRVAPPVPCWRHGAAGSAGRPRAAVRDVRRAGGAEEAQEAQEAPRRAPGRPGRPGWAAGAHGRRSSPRWAATALGCRGAPGRQVPPGAPQEAQEGRQRLFGWGTPSGRLNAVLGASEGACGVSRLTRQARPGAAGTLAGSTST